MAASCFFEKPSKNSKSKQCQCLFLTWPCPPLSILLGCTSKSHESSLAPSQAFLMANSLKRPLQVSTSHDASSFGNKRQREAQVLDGSDIVSEKIKAIEDLHDMGTRQLREQAILRGLSSSGSKKELLDRLCAESEKESKNGTPEGFCNFWPIILKKILL